MGCGPRPCRRRSAPRSRWWNDGNPSSPSGPWPSSPCPLVAFALADQLVNLIEELRIDVNLPVEITTDDTQLLKLSFSGTPDVGFPLQREVCDIPGQVVRRVWNEGLRDYETPTASATPSDETGAGRHAHSEPVQYGVTPDQSRPARHHRSAPAQPRTRVGHDHGASTRSGLRSPCWAPIYPVASSNPPGFQQSATMTSRSPQSV